MIIKLRMHLLAAAFLLLAANQLCGEVDSHQMETVRQKGVLEAGDLQIIDEFISQTVQKLIRCKDLTSIAKLRRDIVANASSATESAAAQYSQQFYQSAQKHISEGFKAAATLAALAIPRLNDRHTIIRYWAVHTITNPVLIKKLNSAGAENLTLAKKIADELAELLVEEQNTEIIVLAAGFAAKTNIPEGEKLLMQIADNRMKGYVSWSIKDELFESLILKLLCEKILLDSPNKSQLARSFSQLYSYVMQRYVKGQGLLDTDQKQQLVSVMVEIEQTCINKLLKIPQSVIKKAVENNDTTVLLDEHDRLLGGPNIRGRVPDTLDFDYGKAPGGSRRSQPMTLPEPPGN